jgi:sterol desaturase/sphingolipid hydroxylase (fatty acid hydroxylase superfamily)
VLQSLWTLAVFALWLEWRSFPGMTSLLVWATFALLFALERGSARGRVDSMSFRETLGDLSYKLWGVLLIDPVLSPALEMATTAAAALRSKLGAELWPSLWPLAARVALYLITVDLLFYGFHRLQHRSGFWWRTHATHHSAVAMGASKTFVNHPIEIACFFVLYALPAVLFGAGVEEVSGAALLSITVQLFAHSSLPAAALPVGWLLTTSAYHTRHHSLRIEESNSNYGCALILWDRLFGTFGGGAPVARLGVGSGVQLTLAQQLALPFRRARPRALCSDGARARS